MKADSFVSELNRDAYMTCYTKDSRNINNGYPVLVWENGGFLVTFNAAGGTCDTLNVIVQEERNAASDSCGISLELSL